MKANASNLSRIASLITCLLMLAAAAVATYGYLLGHDVARGTHMDFFTWGDGWDSLLNAKFIATAAVVLLAAIVPLFSKNKTYRTIQLIANVAVTGCWSGMFISFASMMGIMSYGIRLSMMLLPVMFLIIAFIYPLFGKKNHYCMWVCPLGSAQELMGKLNKKHKLSLSAQTVHRLEIVRDVLWAVLMLLLWTGIWSAWTNYELFTAFMFNVAPLGVTIATIGILFISLFVSRPYCRFVCPTGNLLRLSQHTPAKAPRKATAPKPAQNTKHNEK